MNLDFSFRGFKRPRLSHELDPAVSDGAAGALLAGLATASAAPARPLPPVPQLLPLLLLPAAAADVAQAPLPASGPLGRLQALVLSNAAVAGQMEEHLVAATAVAVQLSSHLEAATALRQQQQENEQRIMELVGSLPKVLAAAGAQPQAQGSARGGSGGDGSGGALLGTLLHPSPSEPAAQAASGATTATVPAPDVSGTSTGVGEPTAAQVQRSIVAALGPLLEGAGCDAPALAGVSRLLQQVHGGTGNGASTGATSDGQQQVQAPVQEQQPMLPLQGGATAGGSAEEMLRQLITIAMGGASGEAAEPRTGLLQQQQQQQ